MPEPRASAELLTLTEVAERLGVHYMTAYRYLRTGRLDGTKHGAEWRVRAADLERFESRAATGRAGIRSPSGSAGDSRAGSSLDGPAAGAGAPRRTRRRIDWAGRATERMVDGDEAGAWSVIESAMAAGMAIEEVYLDLLTPALRSIGDRWESGEITVADEHVASAVTLRLIGRLGPQFSRRGRKRATVVVAAPAGETHSLPIALFADLLRGRGFRVLDLGGDVPADSLTSTVADAVNLLAVCLGCTTAGNEASITEAIAAVRGATPAAVLVGGRAVADAATARSLGADDGGVPTRAALDLIEHLPRLASFPT